MQHIIHLFLCVSLIILFSIQSSKILFWKQLQTPYLTVDFVFSSLDFYFPKLRRQPLTRPIDCFFVSVNGQPKVNSWGITDRRLNSHKDLAWRQYNHQVQAVREDPWSFYIFLSKRARLGTAPTMLPAFLILSPVLKVLIV